MKRKTKIYLVLFAFVLSGLMWTFVITNSVYSLGSYDMDVSLNEVEIGGNIAVFGQPSNDVDGGYYYELPKGNDLGFVAVNLERPDSAVYNNTDESRIIGTTSNVEPKVIGGIDSLEAVIGVETDTGEMVDYPMPIGNDGVTAYSKELGDGYYQFVYKIRVTFKIEGVVQESDAYSAFEFSDGYVVDGKGYLGLSMLNSLTATYKVVFTPTTEYDLTGLEVKINPVGEVKNYIELDSGVIGVGDVPNAFIPVDGGAFDDGGKYDYMEEPILMTSTGISGALIEESGYYLLKFDAGQMRCGLGRIGDAVEALDVIAYRSFDIEISYKSSAYKDARLNIDSVSFLPSVEDLSNMLVTDPLVVVFWIVLLIGITFGIVLLLMYLLNYDIKQTLKSAIP